MTTALPWNLTVKGGRFFADVGRFPHWHDEALPFVDRPPSIDRLFGGESQARGRRRSPGSRRSSTTSADGRRLQLDRRRAQRGAPRGRLRGRRRRERAHLAGASATYFDLTDTLNLELGGDVLHGAAGQRSATSTASTSRCATSPARASSTRASCSAASGTGTTRSSGRRDRHRPGHGRPIFEQQRFRRERRLRVPRGASSAARYSVGVRGDYAEDPFGDDRPADAPTRPSPPGSRRSSSACASSSTRSTWPARTTTSASPCSGPPSSGVTPWLRDSLRSLARRAAPPFSRSAATSAEAALRVVATLPGRRRHDAPDRRRSRRGRDDRAGQPGPAQGPGEAELRDQAEPRRRARRAGARPRARVPARAARGGGQPEDPAHGTGLHRRLDLRPAARGADQPEPLAGRAAPARQSALQPRSGAREADGEGHRRGARRASIRRAPPATRRASRASPRCSTRRSPSGRSWRRRCAA